MTGLGTRWRALALVLALCVTALAGCVGEPERATSSVGSLAPARGFSTPANPLVAGATTVTPDDSAAPTSSATIAATDTPESDAANATATSDAADTSDADATSDTTDAAPAPILDGDPWWHKAIETPDGAYMGVVTAVGLNIRAAPSADAAVVGTTYAKHLLTVYASVWDDAGQTLWYRVGDGQFVAAAFVQPFVAPDPPAIHDGHWVDVNLTDFYAIAYDGSLPVYAAIITAGRDDQTPLGVYTIKYRVRVDDMTSATLGTPASAPGYYDQPDVEYAQYFMAGGFAIHGNYWTPPSEFGTFTSHGCVGMLNSDAAWFWGFLGKGSTVDIHT